MTRLDFGKAILPLVEGLFPTDALRIETCRPPGGEIGKFLPDVRVTHVLSGEAVTCGDHGTQIENKIQAVLELRARIDRA